ncbi:MAG TPA: ABC transporter permease [Vicinamibacterales bacterium]|nr:ABC transporter permease [Vicinamibacterales bacterium]
MRMKPVRRLLHWLDARREDADLRAELEFHRTEVQRHLEARGVDPSQARLQSQRVMGNLTLAREDARDVWAIRTIDVLWRDVRGGARSLRRDPTFAATAILTLAVGVAATTTVFSVVDSELWKPLPFAGTDRLVEVYSTRGGHARQDSISGADFVDWRAGTPAFAELAASGGGSRRTLQREVAESVSAVDVTWNYLQTLGRPAVAGRTFLAEDARAGGVVITDRAWRRLFNGDPSIVGAPLRLDGRPARIVGVVEAVDVEGPDYDLFVPIDETTAPFRDRGQQMLTSATGRLRPGATLAEAATQLQGVAERIAHAYPEGRTGHHVEVEDFRRYYMRNDARPLYLLLVASALVLVLTCVNVAGLLLARALKRRSEFAIRGALGGGFSALVRQLIVEGFCLALPAAAAALLLARWSVGALGAEMPPDYLWRTSALSVDWRVCAFALAICALTAVIFGLAPTVAARRIDLSSTLGDGARTAGATPAQSRTRGLLLSAQVALTVVLLAASGLFLKSYAALTHVPLGFDPVGGVSFRVTLSGTRYQTPEQLSAFADALQQRALVIPGLRRAVIATSSPLISGAVVRFAVKGSESAALVPEPAAIIRAVTPEYFSVLGIRLLQGREFASSDTATAPRVAVINEVLARRYFGGENPIGRTLTILPGQRAPWTRHPGDVIIVGVSTNTREVGLNEVEFSDVYVPFVQMPSPWVELIARTDVPVSAVAAPIRSAAARIDPAIPLGTVTPLDSRIDDALREDRFHVLVMAGFAGVALLLAATGLYGAVAYAAEQRRREFGVRLALGADGRQLVAMALGHALRIAAIGAGAGLVVAVGLAKIVGNAMYLVPRVHNGLLFGVSTSDPVVLGGAVVLLLCVTMLASAVPARKIAWIDPVTSLRQE